MFELFALPEIKQKGNGEVSQCGMNVIILGVQEIEMAKESMAVLKNDLALCCDWLWVCQLYDTMV